MCDVCVMCSGVVELRPGNDAGLTQCDKDFGNFSSPTGVCVCVCVCLSVYRWVMCVCVRVMCVCVCVYVFSMLRVLMSMRDVCVYVCMYVCVCVSVYLGMLNIHGTVDFLVPWTGSCVCVCLMCLLWLYCVLVYLCVYVYVCVLARIMCYMA